MKLGMAVMVTAAALLVGCGGGGGVSGDKGEEGAKKVAEKIKSGSFKDLRPSEANLKTLFDDSVVADVLKHVDKIYGEIGKLELKEDPSDVVCYGTEDIKGGKAGELPGGYKRISDKLKPGVQVCRFKSGSMKVDGVMWADGKWFFIPKAFRAIASDDKD
ncbi:MAG: hypothetical protein U0414_17270 [Polyangiaceae bacterium]